MDQPAGSLETTDRVLSAAVQRGLLHLSLEDESFNGRTIRLGGRDVVNFGSCSYLGLEVDERLKEGAIEAVRRYGTELSSSRAYLASPAYRELEGLLEDIFEGHVLVTPTTTLGHLSALPTLVGPDDAVIVDQQTHHSVQMATAQLTAMGVKVVPLRHNRMDLLEDGIQHLQRDARQVWYLADGVYSMFGDFAPVGELVRLLDQYDQFRLYIDDAHGLSWSGKHGRGYVLSETRLHPKMVLATGLAKGFGTGGGVLVLPDAEQRRRIQTCGGPMIFSGPLQPAVLGAAIASAKIHLSDEITQLQQRLRQRITACNELLKTSRLPVLSSPASPIRFVGVAHTPVAQAMTQRLLKDGFFTNVSHFPAVPRNRAGVRFMMNARLELHDVKDLVRSLENNIDGAFHEEGERLDAVAGFFAARQPGRRGAGGSTQAQAL